MGVHIADVSYFVSEGTALDEVASQRATSCYLVQKVGMESYIVGQYYQEFLVPGTFPF